MNKQKLSLAAIQDKLSRNEMKQIMAGLESVGDDDGKCRKAGETCSARKVCCAGLTCSGCPDTGFECS